MLFMTATHSSFISKTTSNKHDLYGALAVMSWSGSYSEVVVLFRGNEVQFVVMKCLCYESSMGDRTLYRTLSSTGGSTLVAYVRYVSFRWWAMQRDKISPPVSSMRIRIKTRQRRNDELNLSFEPDFNQQWLTWRQQRPRLSIFTML
jgi:hypothetical protein